MNLDRFKDTQIEDNLLIKIGKWIFAVILYIIYLYVIYYIAFDSELLIIYIIILIVRTKEKYLQIFII